MLAVVLASVTIFCMQYLERFFVAEEQLLIDPQFSAKNVHWDEKGGGVATFQNNQLTISNIPATNKNVFQNIKVDVPAYYRFEFKAGVDEVIPASTEEWALATIVVIYRNEAGERIGSRTITSLKGTQALKSYSEKLLLMKPVSSIDLAFRILRAEGILFIAEPVVSHLKEYPFFKILRMIVVAAWIVFAAFVAWMGFQVLQVWQLLLISGLVVIALLGTLVSGPLITNLSLKIVSLLPESFLALTLSVLSPIYGESNLANGGAWVSKLGHVFIFMCIGAFAGYEWRKIGIVLVAASLTVFAFVTEALQTLVYGRSTSLIDVLVDCAGGFSGVLIGVVTISVIELLKQPGLQGKKQ